MAALAALADAPPARAGARPAVLALQEVTEGTMAELRPALRRAGFERVEEQPMRARPSNGAEGYGVALATRAPLGPLRHAEYREYGDTHMGRGLLFGIAAWPGVGDVALGSTHLESFVGPENDAIVCASRRAQLTQAGGWLAAAARAHGCAAAILMGDMNWDDPKMPGGRASPGDGWRDAWEEAGSPKSEKVTCGRSWRFDRCFVLATSGGGGSGGRALGGGASAAAPPSLRVARVGLVGRDQVGTLTVPHNWGRSRPSRGITWGCS